MTYLSGFGNHHQSTAIPNALPENQNSPQQCPFGLYAEQLSGSAFTRPRQHNLRSWLYRILPSVAQGLYRPYPNKIQETFERHLAPNPLRWSAPEPLQQPCDFIEGLFHFSGNDSLNAYQYQCNQSMQHRYMSNADGELLFVPYAGTIQLHTEFGLLELSPGMIAVIPRGVKFKVVLVGSNAAGYLCENRKTPLTLPHLGAIGANGLANPRHFLYPKAAFETQTDPVELICKYQQQWWIADSAQSPLNVVAWHGNYAPYCYDLSLFNTINTVSFDHPDPSIFTVLTSESATPGVATLDFVIFPARWMVAEHTFRPPYFHRNIMNEWMGLVKGQYDAKQTGFGIGGVSIHNCMVAHGPDSHAYLEATSKTLAPEYYQETLAFMLEAEQPWQVTQSALSHASRQTDYHQCWQTLPPAAL